MTETEERHLNKLCKAIESINNEGLDTPDYTHLLKRIAIALEKIAFEKFPYSSTIQRTYDPCYENEYGEKIKRGL